MKVAVTGATGFIGKYLVKYLHEKKYDFTIIARGVENAGECYPFKVNVFECDYSLESLTKAFEGIDVVIHLAAQTMDRDTHPLKLSQFHESNLKLTENVFIAASLCNVKKVCQTSSISVYSNSNSSPFNETELPIPANIYGVSKMACEHLGNLISLKTNTKITNLRLGRLFGVGERLGLVFTNYMSLAMQNKQLEIWGEGKTSIDYIYVKDVVGAIEKAIQFDAPNGTFNIGSNNSYSIKTVAESINNVFDNKGNIAYLRDKKEGGFNLLMDCTKAENELGWKPFWDLDTALNDMKRIINS
ncbi:NAD(P)-dependent oxidoreductase [Marinifilum fragile]|uniref:NAD-dependent epimerase/dehydratase family protein n=1 Tax=Marinifilum fragile TaxID=570161 RepID=UPI002AA8EA1A|nr:NAD(P)-dependent oxidoreductase [Marinifilum fragile]